jgi:hypothetical protein
MQALRSLIGAAALGASLLLPLSPANAAPTETIRAGTTTVVLSQDFLGALQKLGISPAPIAPGRLVVSKAKGVRAAFPITTGAVDLGGPKAEIAHVGGLTLTKGSTRVELSSFIIDLTGGTPVLTGLVVANDSLVARIPLFNLALPANALAGTTEDFLKASNVAVTLNAAAADALNGAFSAPGAFPANFPIGTAFVRGVLEFETH